jgi:hypothetical protein
MPGFFVWRRNTSQLFAAEGGGGALLNGEERPEDTEDETPADM